MSRARRNRKKERQRRERELERRAQDLVASMPKPRLMDEPAALMRWSKRWTMETERKAGGDPELLDKVQDLGAKEVAEHVARHLHGPVVASRAADEALRRVDKTAEDLAEFHEQYGVEHRAYYTLAGPLEESVGVNRTAAGQTMIWKWGEAEEDPDRAVLEELRVRPWPIVSRCVYWR